MTYRLSILGWGRYSLALLLGLGLVFAPPAFPDEGRAVIGTINLNQGITPTDMVTELLCGDIPGNVHITKVRWTGANTAGGTFTGGLLPIGIAQGIVMSTGVIGDIPGGPKPFSENRTDANRTSYRNPGDPDVSRICRKRTRDAAVLEFNITVDSPRILRFRWVFGSDEYNEYATSRYNDGFGIWVKRKIRGRTTNIARLRAAPRNVCINNVNAGVAGWGPGVNVLSGSWKDRVPFGMTGGNDCNDLTLIPPGGGAGPHYPCGSGSLTALPWQTEMDGMTTVHRTSRRRRLRPGWEYEVKIAIADASDTVWDSDVFIKGDLRRGRCRHFAAGARGVCTSCDDDVYVEDCPSPSIWDEGVLCSDTPDPCGDAFGVCCTLQTDGCEETTAAECAGAWVATVTCEEQGTCVIGPDCYDGLTAECCAEFGGSFVDDEACELEGACCQDDPPACVELTEVACETVGGTYNGDDTECEGDNDGDGVDDACEPGGACCSAAGCEDGASQDHCEAGGNAKYMGDGTTCEEACPNGIPAVTEWGLVVMLLLVLAAGTVVLKRARALRTTA